MTIKYKCRISSASDPKEQYKEYKVEIESEYPIPSNRLRKIVIDKLPRYLVSFGHMYIEANLEEE